MNLIAIVLTRHVDDVIFLCTATDLNAYSFIKKKAFKEAALFVARTVPSRCITCCLHGVAFYMINEIYMDFIRLVPKKEWSEVKQDNKISFDLNSYLEKYKDPLACDAIAQTNIKISENIEKVRVTMDTLIRNRENLDVLVDKSKDLSSTTKQLFKQSKKLKRKQCCRIM
ncbi:prenylated protein, putative [Plasmodium ovale]|uniref:Prenylated protein, putative n=1 Tax=Plasmodium ovale TaxID=36330 RepID=A0A1D3U7I6_PLAOA|nr:prenylated protein, putative [Plasmodium ovale]